MANKCERCDDYTSKKDERFCPKCRKQYIADMKESGYLQRVSTPTHRNGDLAGPRGCGDASWDNAVRAIEDG